MVRHMLMTHNMARLNDDFDVLSGLNKNMLKNNGFPRPVLL